MGSVKYDCLLISDFMMSGFAALLTNDTSLPVVRASIGPYGQVMPILLDQTLLNREEYDFAIVWTRPEGVIKSFQKVIGFDQVSIETVLSEVDEFSHAILSIKDRVKYVFCPTWVFPSNFRGYGLLDMKSNLGVANILMQMNLRLSQNLRETSNIFILNTQKWIETAGRHAFSPKMWYMAKIPFGNEVFKEAQKDMKAALRGLAGQARKIIMLDLDDTLWGGIVGDVGWENIQLGGHDNIGEAFVDFQHALKSLTKRGVLLGIVSKNEETIAIETIEKHPEMVLKLEDFAGWKINWGDKAQNVVDLAMDLNLGLQSVVFIDDNPVERDRVREALPEVYVPEWPEDKMLYANVLYGLDCFDTPSISEEDLARAKMYNSERQREKLKIAVSSLDEWLKSLKIKVIVEELKAVNLPRAAQLLNKTNQMNLSTRRMTETELKKWAETEGHKLWTFKVSDKFGNSGLTGIISIEVGGDSAKIVDFVLSCRVIGRNIENTMLQVAVREATSMGLKKILAVYLPTPKNKPCLKFLEESGFTKEDNEIFTWDLDREYSLPEHIELIDKDDN